MREHTEDTGRKAVFESMSLNFNLNLSGALGQSAHREMNPKDMYDTLIIGGGPAGLNAALYAMRKGLKTGIIAQRIGGQVVDTSSVENYLGINHISGEDLMHKFEDHIHELDIPITSNQEVTSATKVTDHILITISDGTVFRTKTLIIATGSKPRYLNVPGEKALTGKGVAYCAICDGPLFKDREIAVAGGGNSAVEAAIDLSKICKKVTLIHRSELRADQILIDAMNKLDNIVVMIHTEIQEIQGTDSVRSLRLLSKDSGDMTDYPVEGIFIEIGYTPNSAVFEGLLDMTERGEILINDKTETSIPGIFAAGDVSTVPYKQIIISASEGAKAALAVNDYLKTH